MAASLQFHPDNMVWIDLEMSGLDEKSERILEVAVAVTDRHFNDRTRGVSVVLRQDAAILDAMDRWNRNTHGASGLLERVRRSRHDEVSAEEKLLEYLRRYVPPGTSPLSGFRVQKDREFLKAYMPRLNAFFHYSNFDLNTLVEMAMRFNPKFLKRKENAHSALDDVHEAIDMAQHFRALFRPF